MLAEDVDDIGVQGGEVVEHSVVVDIGLLAVAKARCEVVDSVVGELEETPTIPLLTGVVGKGISK